MGPFSFQAFVQAGWTETKLQSHFEANHKVFLGRRRKLIVGKGCRKRPLALEVLQRQRKRGKFLEKAGAKRAMLQRKRLTVL